MKGDLFIDTYLVPDSSLVFTKGRLDFEKTERTINNTLVSDFIGFKKTFALEWGNWLDGDFVDYIIGIYEAKEDVEFKEVLADNTEEVSICKLSISDSYVREYKEKNFAFSGFTVSLEEV